MKDKEQAALKKNGYKKYRTCKTHGILEIGLFYFNQKRETFHCRECAKNSAKKTYHKNREFYRKIQNEYYQKTKHIHRARSRINSKKYREIHKDDPLYKLRRKMSDVKKYQKHRDKILVYKRNYRLKKIKEKETLK